MTTFSTALRRWCPRCHLVTVSWMDGGHNERCSRCDPEDLTAPGYGIRDEDEDAPGWSYDDDEEDD